MAKFMSSQKIITTFILGASALSLSACGIGHPNAMPSGYTYHHQEFKSPTPAPSSKVTVKQRQNMDAVQAEQFRNAVYDLLNKMTMRAGMAPKPVYVVAPDPMTTFYANIDNDLRESMRAIGYAISDVPVGSYVFAYSAQDIEYPQGVDIAGQPNVELTLRVFDSVNPEARQLTQEIGRYYIQGAEDLYIKPTNYSQLPTFKRIQSQMEGFEEFEPTRTATGALNSEVKLQSNQMPMVEQRAIAEPSAPVEYTTMPIEPMVIDSYGVSEDTSMEVVMPEVSYAPSGYEDYQPSVPRARVSKKINY